MSKTVDQRIVEMRFDNNQFEQNVKTSMSTLDRLKQALKLDGASRGLENVSKASKGLDFSSIASNVESLASRFSTFGIIGMRVLERMTDSCINFAQKGIGFVTSKIIEGGKRRAFNIENAHFQLQGLLKDEEKVQAVMADAMESVDGTAYAYDEAAKAASQFAASGLQAGEEMLGALRGITGVAAMTNSDYESISRIFTTVAGNGRMMGDQLLQLSSRGLNAASTLAEYFNKVKDGSVQASDEVTTAIKKLSGSAKVTEADIREWTSKGSISFKMFASAMDETFGEHAKKANETFTGAMANMGAALARIGAKFVSPLIEQNGPFVKLFNTLRMRINDVNKQMDPFAQKFTHNVNAMATSLSKYFSTLNMEQGIEKTMKKLQRVFNHLVGIGKELGNIFFPFIKRTVDEFKMFGRVLEGDHVLTPLDRLGDALTHVHVVLGKVSYAINQNHGLMQNWRNTIRGVLAVFDILAQVIGAVFRVFGPTNAEIGNAAEGMLSLTGGVGEYLYELDQWLKKSNAIEESLRNFKKYVTDGIDSIINSVPGLKEMLDELEQTFNNITASDVTAFLRGLGDALSSAIEQWNNLSKNHQTAKHFLELLIIEIDKLVGSITGGEHPVIKTLGSMYDKFADTFEKVEELLRKAKERFNKFLDGLDFRQTSKDLFGAGSIIYALYEFKRLIDSKVKVGNSLSGALNQIKLAVMEWRKGSKWNVLIKIASALAILAGSLWLVAQVPADRIMPAAKAISYLGICLIGFFEILQLLDKNGFVGNIDGQMKSIYGIVIALGGMAFILVQIAKIGDPALISAGVNAIVVMLSVLAGACAVISAYSKGLERAAPGVAMVVVALIAMVGAMYLLQFIDFASIEDGLLGLGFIMGALYLFCREVSKLHLNDLNIDPKAFEALIPLAAAVVILAVAMKMLSGLNFGELVRGIIGTAAGLGMLLGALAFVDSVIKEADTEKLIGAAGAMMLVAIAMDLLLPSILILGAIPWDVLARGMVATIFGIGALAGALWLTSKAVSSGQLLAAGGGMMMIAAAMNMLLPVVIAFGVIPFEYIGKGIGIFLGALLGFAVVGKVATSAAVGLLALGASLLMISTSITITGIGLSLIAGALLKITVALTLFSLAAKTALPEFIEMCKQMTIEFLTMLPDILTALTEALGQLLAALLDQITLLAPKLGEALTAVLLSLIATFVSCVPAFVEGLWVMVSEILESMKDYLPLIVGTVFDFIILVINKLTEKTPAIVRSLADFLRTLFGAIIEEIKKIDATAVVENLQAVGMMAKLMAAFAGLAILTAPALAGVIGMSSVVAELTLVLTAMGKLSEIPGLTMLIGEGGNLLESIGTAIGKFAGGIAGGFSDGMSKQLPGIGNDLSTFMNNLEGFITGCERIKPDTLTSAKTLGEVILALTVGSILDGITRFMGLGKSSLAKFGTELEEFGPHFAAFADSIKDVQAGTVIASARAAEALTAMANNLPNSGGVISWFTGDNQLAEFAKGLKPFGEAMAEYSATVDGKINEGTVESSIRAATMISDLATKLPNSGGVISWFTGDNDLREFGSSIRQFGWAMASYSETVDGKINKSAVEASINAATIISDFATKLPKVGGLITIVTGDNSLSKFATELSLFAPKYKEYSDIVSGVPAGVVMASAHCINSLVEVANGLTGSNGLKQLINGGNKSLFAFGEELEKLGKSYGKYFDQISRTDPGKINESINQLKEFITVASQISGEASTGLGSLASFITQAASIGKDLMQGLSNGISEGASSISKSIETVAKSIIDTAKKILGVHSPSTVFAEIGRYLIEGLANGITKAKATVSIAMKTLATNLLNAARTGLPKEQFTSISVNQIINGLIAGLNSGKDLIMSNIRTICDGMIQRFKTCLPATTFKSIGSSIISAIISGMNTKKDALSASIKQLCDQIATSFKENINADQYMEVGTAIIQAIAAGINAALSSDNGNNPIASATKAVSNAIINAFKTGLPQSTFVSIGKNVASGLEKGIREGVNNAKKAAEDTAKSVVESTKNALGVRSPSTVYTEIGKHLDEGLARGITQYTSVVEGSSEEMADRLIKATRAACIAVNYILEHGLEDGPVIRPVVDLSNADYALNRLQNEFGNGLSARMASSVSLTTNANTISELADRLESINSIGNRNVVEAIGELRNDVDRLNDSMSRLKVVMDSGALVGSIAPAMDTQLGRIANLKSRGI